MVNGDSNAPARFKEIRFKNLRAIICVRENESGKIALNAY